MPAQSIKPLKNRGVPPLIKIHIFYYALPCSECPQCYSGFLWGNGRLRYIQRKKKTELLEVSEGRKQPGSQRGKGGKDVQCTYEFLFFSGFCLCTHFWPLHVLSNFGCTHGFECTCKYRNISNTQLLYNLPVQGVIIAVGNYTSILAPIFG